MLLIEAALLTPLFIFASLGAAQFAVLFITAQSLQTCVNSTAMDWSAGSLAGEGEAEAAATACLAASVPWVTDVHVEDTRSTATAYVVSAHISGPQASIIGLLPVPPKLFASALVAK